MNKKTTEHAASVLKEIKTEINPDVIKDYEMPTLCNMETARETGFAVILTLSTKFDYTSAVLDDWKHARMMVECSLEYCDHYKIGLRSGVKKDYYNVLESGMYINDITKMITDAGKTVYLKESTRKLLQRCFKADYYDIIMARTVDLDGNKIENEVPQAN